MKRSMVALVAAMLVTLASCEPVSDATDTTVQGASTTAVSATPDSVADSAVSASTAVPTITATTLPDPTGDFLEPLSAAPPVTAVIGTGFRRWARQDGVWIAEPLSTFPDGPFDQPPFAASTAAGIVYGSPDGAIHLANRVAASRAGTLVDVAMAGEVPVAIVVDGANRVAAVNLSDGSDATLYEASGEITSASYAAGRLLVVRGSGSEAIATVVDDAGTTRALDLLTDGNPASVTITPDGATMVFSTDLAGDAAVYTLVLGSQGPAAPYPLPVEGSIASLDTNGSWVSGLVGQQSFLLDLGTGEVFVGPPGVRFVFDRDDRPYLGPGVGRIIDGRFFGYVHSADGDGITFDEAELLTGEDAAAAAEAAGEESPPPNDFFIRNGSDDVLTIPLVIEPDVRIQGDVLQAGIGLEPVTLAQWLALLDGDPTVIEFEWYGAGTLPYWITVENRQVTALEEVYLP